MIRQESARIVDEGEEVSIRQLMWRIGLSRGFFYKNTQVRKENDRIFELQVNSDRF
ncbi:hypothetical protein C817_00740 [Dorea sp. 5-2]|nr:hypothetical protein C817_00740 [Dorea sp. 5-2]